MNNLRLEASRDQISVLQPSGHAAPFALTCSVTDTLTFHHECMEFSWRVHKYILMSVCVVVLVTLLMFVSCSKYEAFMWLNSCPLSVLSLVTAPVLAPLSHCSLCGTNT